MTFAQFIQPSILLKILVIIYTLVCFIGGIFALTVGVILTAQKKEGALPIVCIGIILFVLSILADIFLI